MDYFDFTHPWYNQQDKAAYFSRVGLAGEEMSCCLETLESVIKHHITSIPMGVLSSVYHHRLDSPMLPRPVNPSDPYSTMGISLHPADIFDKLVTKRREGVCFEHTGLLGHILGLLGFECSMIIGQIHDTNTGAKLPGRFHAMLLVSISSQTASEQYLVDAGFGISSPYVPVPLSSSYPRKNQLHRITAQKSPRQYRLELMKAPNKWVTLYSMALQPAYQNDAELIVRAIMASTNHVFYKNILLSMATPDNGSLHLVNDTLYLRDHNRRIVAKRALNSESARRSAFLTIFNIVLSPKDKEHLPINFKLPPQPVVPLTPHL